MEATARERSRAALAAALLVAAFGVADLARGAPALALVLAARAVWIAALLAVSRALLRPGSGTGAFVAAASSSVFALAALAWADRGGAGGPIVFLVTAPLFVAVFLPDRPAPTALASVLAVVCAAGVASMHGRPPSEIALLTLRAAVAGGFATLCTALHARVRRAEAATVDELARVADALEASERQRAEGDPIAVATTRVRAVAHDMSSPIATIACNLEWLRSAAREGRVHLDDAEALDVLDDARAAADRLRDRIGALREAAGRARATSRS